MMGRHKKAVDFSVLFVVVLSLCCPVRAEVMDLYAMSVETDVIYGINLSTGNITSYPALYPSIGIASDDRYLYYWNADNVTQRGIVKWDPFNINMHTIINSIDISEENACTSSDGMLWLLDRTNSYDPTLGGGKGGFLGDDTRYLYQVDKATGNRTVYATLPDVGGYAVGDIAWGPDSKLYISTHNTLWGYDAVNNYVWDPDTGNIDRMSGSYYAGLAWVGDELYGSRTPLRCTTGVIFQLNPLDFSEIRQVAVMPTGVSIGDLSSGIIPEPATISILALGVLLLRKRKAFCSKFC